MMNSNMDKIFRVGIYLRLSEEDRDKISKLEISESIKNQRLMLLEVINKNSNFMLVDEYCDEDLSGAGTYRPEFERLINDCKNKKIDIVLCKSQSRFSRDMEIVEKYINNKFKEWGVRFISLADNADTDNPGNKKSRQINGLVNEWYLEDTSNNIRAAFNTKMKHGEFISPFAPYGYEVSSENNNKLVIDPIASGIVKNIFNLYLNGYGYTGIAKYLNNKNIPSPSLYKYLKGVKLNIVSNRSREQIKWSANAIKNILTNEIYLGNLVQGKRTTISYKNHKLINKDKNDWIRVESTHEAIICKDIFNKVQFEINHRTKSKSSVGIIHNFSGKVFCLNCNCYLRKKNSLRHEYLVCSNNRDGYNNCINRESIRYDFLEKIVLVEINKFISIYYDEERLINLDKNNRVDSPFNNLKILEKQVKDINKKIVKNRGYIKSLYEDKVDGIISEDYFKFLMDDYSRNEEFYNNQLDSIKEEINKIKWRQHNKKKKILFNKNKAFDKLNRAIIDEFVYKIYVGNIDNTTNTRNIKIIWNF